MHVSPNTHHDKCPCILCLRERKLLSLGYRINEWGEWEGPKEIEERRAAELAPTEDAAADLPMLPDMATTEPALQ